MFLGTGYGAGHEIVVPAQRLRGAVNHQVRPKVQRILVVGRREGIVDHHHRPDRVRRGADHLQVYDLTEGVAGRLQNNHPRVWFQVVPDASRVVGIHPGKGNAHPLQNQGHLVIRAVGVMKNNHVVARLEIGQVHHGAGRHARGAYNAILRVFQRRQLFFYRPDGRVVITMIRVAVNFTVRDLAKHVEREIFIIYGIDDGRNHRTVTVRGKRVGVHAGFLISCLPMATAP